MLFMEGLRDMLGFVSRGVAPILLSWVAMNDVRLLSGGLSFGGGGLVTMLIRPVLLPVWRALGRRAVS